MKLYIAYWLDRQQYTKRVSLANESPNDCSLNANSKIKLLIIDFFQHESQHKHKKKTAELIFTSERLRVSLFLLYGPNMLRLLPDHKINLAVASCNWVGENISFSLSE